MSIFKFASLKIVVSNKANERSAKTKRYPKHSRSEEINFSERKYKKAEAIAMLQVIQIKCNIDCDEYDRMSEAINFEKINNSKMLVAMEINKDRIIFLAR